MLYLNLHKMAKIQDIIFWIIILSVIAIAIWLLSGSPPTENALVSIALFIAASELIIWKFCFSLDKKSAVGFMKIKNEMDKINDNLIKINNKLSIIENKAKR